MLRIRMAVRLVLVGFVTMIIALGCSGGGAQKISMEDQGRLTEAKTAAESAERKLAELRQERIQLEQGLDGVQGETAEEFSQEQPTQ